MIPILFESAHLDELNDICGYFFNIFNIEAAHVVIAASPEQWEILVGVIIYF